MTDVPNLPPPPAGGGGYPPPGAPMGMPGGVPAEHPRGTQLLILSIVGLLCCAPVDIYTLISSNSALREAVPGMNMSKVNTARIISIVGLALWVVGLILRLTVLKTTVTPIPVGT